MRTFVITDIHGHNDLFKKSLKTIGLKKKDKLILLGDVIDRGPDSKGLLDTIILLQDHGFDVTCLIGNHEQMMLNAHLSINNLNLWLMNGGDKTLSSFLTGSLDKIPTKYLEFIKSFKDYYEYNNFIFVHAALNMNIDDPFSDKKTLLWERKPYDYLNKEWLGTRTIIHGHNPMNKGEITETIKNQKPIISIDNGVYSTKEEYGSMCVLQLENLNIQFIK